MNEKFALILTFLAGIVFSSYGQTSNTAELCATGNKYKIDLHDSSKFVTITPKDFKSDGDPYITHNVDLNNDGLKDLIINLKDCTDPTHCKFGLFLQCEDGSYVSLYKPSYWLPSFRISKDETGWREIILYDRDLEIGRIFVKDTLKFDGKNYSVK